MKKLSMAFLVLLIFIFISNPASAFLKADGYIGLDEEPNIITFTGVKSFPYNLSLFGFVDFITETKDNNNDFTAFYGEAKLTMDIWNGLGIIAEFDDGSKADSLFRGGISYRPSFFKDYKLQLRILPYRSDNEGGQVSVSFHKDICDRFFLEGWADFNYLYDGSTSYIAEPQFGIKITKDLYTVIEYRINNFKKGRHKTNDAIGLGIEYRF